MDNEELKELVMDLIRDFEKVCRSDSPQVKVQVAEKWRVVLHDLRIKRLAKDNVSIGSMKVG